MGVTQENKVIARTVLGAFGGNRRLRNIGMITRIAA